MASLLLFAPLGLGLFLAPLGYGALALYSLTVRPRAFAASGSLLAAAAFVAWGLVDSLQKCARFNRGPGGGCQADPGGEVVIAVVVGALALLMTGIAVWQVRRTRPAR